MKWIKDSVYGDIQIDSLVEELIDTPQMQRLRRLSQIPFANLVYPGANHTRFEHSLGVYYLTEKFCNYAGIKGELAQIMKLYGLLHDVGHTAFPHVLEHILIEKMNMTHEDIGLKIIEKSQISDILKANGYEPRDLESILTTPEGKAITGHLGTDRVDYLLRDSKYTGVAYGIIDVDRLMRKQMVRNGQLVLDISGLSSAEYLLIARFMMFASVYNHKTKATASLMIDKAVTRALEDGTLSVNDVITLDDWSLSFKLINAGGETGKLVKDIMNRNLYKRVFEKRLKDFKNWLFLGGMTRRQMRTIEREIAEDAGVSDLDVIFYIPTPWFRKLSIKVWYKDDIYSIREISLISRILNEAQWDYMYVYVLSKKDVMERVKPHAERVMKAIEEERL